MEEASGMITGLIYRHSEPQRHKEKHSQANNQRRGRASGSVPPDPGATTLQHSNQQPSQRRAVLTEGGMHIHCLPGSGVQLWRSSHSHSCERCVPRSCPSQLNIMQTGSWWFRAADCIFDGLTSNRSSVWSNSFPRCDSSYAVNRLKPPNWGIQKAINHRLLSPRSSHTCLVIVFLFSSSCWWRRRAKEPGSQNLSSQKKPFAYLRAIFSFRICVWTEQVALDGKPDVGMKWDNIYSAVSFSSFGHPSLRLERVSAVEHAGQRWRSVVGVHVSVHLSQR